MPGLLTKQDQKAIESILYEPKSNLLELNARRIVRINTSFNPNASVIAYKVYDRKGKADVLAVGAGANDVTFVGEDGLEFSQRVVDIATGIRYTEDEVMRHRAASVLGGGPTLPIDTLRIAAARRFVAEAENKLAFVGHTKLKMKGLLNAQGIFKQNAPNGAGGTPDWASKTPQEILQDIIKLRAQLQDSGIFEAKLLVLPPKQYNMLIQPYSSNSPISLMEWLRSQGDALPPVMKALEMKGGNNGDTVDYMMMIDNDPTNVELAILRDMRIGKTYERFFDTFEIPVTERTAGVIIRHPQAIAIYKGI